MGRRVVSLQGLGGAALPQPVGDGAEQPSLQGARVGWKGRSVTVITGGKVGSVDLGNRATAVFYSQELVRVIKSEGVDSKARKQALTDVKAHISAAKQERSEAPFGKVLLDKLQGIFNLEFSRSYEIKQLQKVEKALTQAASLEGTLACGKKDGKFEVFVYGESIDLSGYEKGSITVDQAEVMEQLKPEEFVKLRHELGKVRMRLKNQGDKAGVKHVTAQIKALEAQYPRMKMMVQTKLEKGLQNQAYRDAQARVRTDIQIIYQGKHQREVDEKLINKTLVEVENLLKNFKGDEEGFVPAAYTIL
jgi:hypothetical protein